MIKKNLLKDFIHYLKQLFLHNYFSTLDFIKGGKKRRVGSVYEKIAFKMLSKIGKRKCLS